MGRRGLSTAERQSVSDIAAQLLVHSYNHDPDFRENLKTYAYGDSQEQVEESEENEENNNDVIVNHVKQLLNEVIDAVVSDNHSESSENQSVQSQTMNTNNNNNNVADSVP